MRLVIAIPPEGDGGHPMRALTSLQHFKEFAFRLPSGKFVRTPITLVGITNLRGKIICDQHARPLPDQLRHMANVEIGANAPWLADELLDIANRLEREMSGEYTGEPER